MSRQDTCRPTLRDFFVVFNLGFITGEKRLYDLPDGCSPVMLKQGFKHESRSPSSCSPEVCCDNNVPYCWPLSISSNSPASLSLPASDLARSLHANCLHATLSSWTF